MPLRAIILHPRLALRAAARGRDAPGPGKRTVRAASRALGLHQTRRWTRYHRVLNRAEWSGFAVGRTLLGLLVAPSASPGPVLPGMDETIERRWGAKLAARGRHRDAVRLSKDDSVKASGRRRRCLMRHVPIPWAGRARALPFLTSLAPSRRHVRAASRRHKKLPACARRALPRARRRLPARPLVAVAGRGYAAIAVMTRRRLAARGRTVGRA